MFRIFKTSKKRTYSKTYVGALDWKHSETNIVLLGEIPQTVNFVLPCGVRKFRCHQKIMLCFVIDVGSI